MRQARVGALPCRHDGAGSAAGQARQRKDSMKRNVYDDRPHDHLSPKITTGGRLLHRREEEPAFKCYLPRCCPWTCLRTSLALWASHSGAVKPQVAFGPLKAVADEATVDMVINIELVWTDCTS